MMHKDIDDLIFWMAMDASALDWMVEREHLDEVEFKPSLCYRLSIRAMRRNPLKWYRNQMRTPVQRVLRAVASFLLTISILFAAVMTVSPSARAMVKQWLMEWCEGESVEYHFTDDTIQGDPRDYELMLIPDGYVEIDRFEKMIRKTVRYQNSEKNLLRFTCQVMESGTATSLWTDSSEIKYINIYNHHAELYLSNDLSTANNLVWHDTDLNLQFSLYGFVDENTLIAMAESVKAP